MMRQFLEEIETLNLLDVGCSGALDARWSPVEKYLNVIGFDPNQTECERLSRLSHPFRSVSYLPYVIGAAKGRHGCTRRVMRPAVLC